MNIVTLRDAAGTTEARILVDLGFNCFQFKVTIAGETVDALWAESSFADGSQRASGSGIPLLFPFPGRLCGTTFSWEGKTYEIEAGDGRGNAIHGFVHTRPWRIVAQSDSSLTGEFRASLDDPAILSQWPADFRIRVKYSLTAGCLLSEIEIENPDDHPLPWGFGTHGYFRLPLGGSSADRCLVQIPAGEEWELKEMLPSGKRIPLANPSLAHGAPFGGLELDNVFGNLRGEKGEVRASIFDPQSKLRCVTSCDEVFRELVVYTPPHRQAICIEPYTMVAGGWDLFAAGHDTGVKVLPPGQKLTTKVCYELQSDADE